MNQLLESDLLREIPCAGNFAYTLADNSLFLPTEYKVLQNQKDGGFVRCMKLLYNGDVQLYYLVDEQKSLAALLPTLTPEDFLTVVTNLFGAVQNLKDNGFLSCMNVEISFDKIFVATNTLKVSLVYLPLSRHLFDEPGDFESQLRASLVRVINKHIVAATPKVLALAEDLMDGTLPLEALSARIKGKTVVKKEQPKAEPAAKRPLRLVTMNAAVKAEFVVDKDHYLIGKSKTDVDGKITFNAMVSRVHCCVDKHGDQYTIMDMESTNGTFVNGIRLQPKVPHPVKNGDIVKLANSKFQIII